ncbi:hypothetical protein D3C81_1129660 [compost metagenome]
MLSYTVGTTWPFCNPGVPATRKPFRVTSPSSLTIKAWGTSGLSSKNWNKRSIMPWAWVVFSASCHKKSVTPSVAALRPPRILLAAPVSEGCLGGAMENTGIGQYATDAPAECLNATRTLISLEFSLDLSDAL